MAKSYDHKKIEKHWQKVWKDDKLYETKDKIAGKENFYQLVEFPYPSGNLHVGHWYAFSVPDIFVRAKRMQGFNVMYPIGFDAFGLPAENAAIKNNVNPREWTEGNIKYMKKQLSTMGASFDWSREVQTTDPEYYKWTQWMFLQFFKNDLAYQGEATVNWCPSCKTVLANEQVIKGKCERCSSEVEQRSMKQWMLKITDFAHEMLEALDDLDWPEEIKASQRNWIGRSEGALIQFPISNSQFSIEVFTTRPDTIYGATYMVVAPENSLISNLKSQISNFLEVEDYVKKANKKTELERMAEGRIKTGVKLKGVKAVNPATKEKISVWVADYVLATIGTGAIMAVPAHDARDFEFAKKFKLAIRKVIEPPEVGSIPRNLEDIAAGYKPEIQIAATVWTGDGEMVNSDEFNGRPSESARQQITEKFGKSEVQYRMRDWIISRQRYWGVPIPIIHCPNCAAKSFKMNVKETIDFADPSSFSDLASGRKTYITRALEQGKNYDSILVGDYVKAFDNKTKKTLLLKVKEVLRYGSVDELFDDSKVVEQAFEKKFKSATELKDHYESNRPGYAKVLDKKGVVAFGVEVLTATIPVPEQDLPVVLPELKDFKPKGDGKGPLANATNWVNVLCPQCQGGAQRETDTLDTFIDSSWYFLRYCDPVGKQKFASTKKLQSWMPVDRYSGGAEHTTMHLLYSRFWCRALNRLGLLEWAEPYKVRMNRSLILGPDGQKMSKSRGNVVDPDEVVEKLGADTVRMYLAFIGPYNEVNSYPWNPKGIKGIRRFLERAWRFANVQTKGHGSKVRKDGYSSVGGLGFRNTAMDVRMMRQITQKTIKKVTDDIEAFKFNTAIAALMVLLNEFEDYKSTGLDLSKEFYIFLKLLAPFAPHMTEEIWREVLEHKKSIHLEKWPEYDEKLIQVDKLKIPVQINGKVRAMLEVGVGLTEEDIRVLALQDKNVAKHLEGKEVKKFVYVQDKIVNFVTK